MPPCAGPSVPWLPGELDTVERIVKANIPRWSRGILRVTGARMTVEGQKNIPAGPCVFVGNHRSYYDIPILLTALDAPHGILAKEELEKIPPAQPLDEAAGLCVRQAG